MADLNFPKDRTELDPPGSGPLQTGDEYIASDTVWVYNQATGAWGSGQGKSASEIYLRLDASNGPITSDLTVNGDVTANSFSGDGSNLTGIEFDATTLKDADGNIVVQASATGIDVTGAITATDNITAYSDASLKENIQSIGNALDKVLQLRGVEFDRTDLKGVRQIGVIAQEVESVIPEVVVTGKEGLKSVAYGNLVGVLIEAIKDLNAEVKDLKAKLEG